MLGLAAAAIALAYLLLNFFSVIFSPIPIIGLNLDLTV